MLCDGPDRWPDSTGYAKSSLKMEPGSTGSRISEFGTVYGNFVFYRYRLLLAGKSFRFSYRYIPSFAACFLREVFGKCSGRLRELPKPSRRNPEETPDTTRLKSSRRFCPEYPLHCSKTPGKEELPYTVPNSEIRLPARRILVGPAGVTGAATLFINSTTHHF